LLLLHLQNMLQPVQCSLLRERNNNKMYRFSFRKIGVNPAFSIGFLFYYSI
jgi:hypothetical protein